MLKQLFIISLLFLTAYAQLQENYESQCPGSQPFITEQDFPCTWTDELATFDIGMNILICHDVPADYTVSYSVENHAEDPNEYGYSVSLFDRYTYWEAQGYGAIPSTSANLNDLFTWKSAYPPNTRANAAATPQPANAVCVNGQCTYDFSAEDHIEGPVAYESGRSGVSAIVIGIDREEYATSFPCFDLKVSVVISA